MFAACPLWTAAAFVAQPRHHQLLPALRHRVARPVAISVDDAMPIIAFGVGLERQAYWSRLADAGRTCAHRATAGGVAGAVVARGPVAVSAAR